jgi:SAM-dependent methyltransferase
VLARLVDPDCPRVLDVGCGTGEIARRIAPLVEHVDAVDLSPAMLARGRCRLGGDAPNLRWIEGEVETVALAPPYGLITAAASLHWMDWSVVLPRFAQCLTPTGVLAMIFEHSEWPGLDLEALWKLIRDSATNRDYQPFDLVAELVQRRLFITEGEKLTEPLPREESIADLIGSIHARNGFSRERMGPEADAAFDDQATQILRSVCPDGIVRSQLRARVVWGRPVHPHLNIVRLLKAAGAEE